MEVKVGILHVQREITVETAKSAADVEQALTAALADGQLLRLEDEKGRSVLIPVANIAYVDLGIEHVRPVGFGTV